MQGNQIADGIHASGPSKFKNVPLSSWLELINVGINVEKAEASGFALGPPSLSVGKDVISAGPKS